MTDVSELTVDRSDSLRAAMRQIDRTGLGAVFVVEPDGRLCGVATDGDIRRGLLEGTELSAPIETVMHEDPIAVLQAWDKTEIRRHLDLDRIQEVVHTHNPMMVPVVDGEQRVVDWTHIDKSGNLLDRTPSDTVTVDSVLVIGGAGYIGSVLSRQLLDAGYSVRVLDKLLFSEAAVADLRDHERFSLVEGDMRSIETVVNAITGMDAVIHLGALVGDPASAIEPQKTLEMNYHSTKMIGEICRYHQINRFIFASTCSVYGKSEAPEELLAEDSSLNPVSLYARTKLESERALLEMADENFSPTIFRMATVYGLSPRMRFDLVVNILSAKAELEGTIPIFGGDQYRPNVHVRDAAKAYIYCLEAPISDVSGEVFNVGTNEQNYRIIEIGELIQECVPDAEIVVRKDKEDDRSYRVDFSKVDDVLDYEAEMSIPEACEVIVDAIQDDRFDDYTDPIYNNYKTLDEKDELFQNI